MWLENSKRAPIGGGMQAAVVVQIDRCVRQIAGQSGPKIGELPPPLQIVHAQPMH
jgi:hypothetical protein